MPKHDELVPAKDIPHILTVVLYPEELLAIAAALRVMDDDLAADEGILPGLMEPLQRAFESIDTICERHFGDDWPVLVATQERLNLEAGEEEAESRQGGLDFGTDDEDWI